MNSPLLFVCGVPRSGTTLLQRMLDHHPRLAVANDSHFIPRALEMTDRRLTDWAEQGRAVPLTRELKCQTFEYHRFYRLGISREEFERSSEGAATYQELVGRLYQAFATRQGKELAGEKTPDYLRRIRLLHGLFPTAKFIHIIRDGRDVALSLLDWAQPDKGPGRIELWRRHPIAVCALWWSWLIEQANCQSTELPPGHLLTLRYESLVEQPQSTLHSICQFLNLDYAESMLQVFEHRHQPGQTTKYASAKKAWLPPTRGLRDWSSQMPAEDQEVFELLAGDTLVESGYSLNGRAPTDRSIEIAVHCRHWWNQNFLPKQHATRPPGRGIRTVATHSKSTV